MQTATANLDWNRCRVNKTEENSTEPNEIFPPLGEAKRGKSIMEEVNTGIVILI